MKTIYVDGGCRVHTSKKGSFAFVVLDENNKLIHEESYEEENTTSIVMEISSVIAALEYLIFYTPVTCDEKLIVYSDSKYVVNGINKWIQDWIPNGWKTKTGSSVQHKDLWRLLFIFKRTLNVEFRWIKGHAGDKWNEHVHKLVENKLK